MGRHMVAELAARGYWVDGVDLEDHISDIPHVREVWDDARHVFAGSNTLFSETRYDLIAHCAYWVGGRAAIDGNKGNLAKNLQLDAAMFDWAVRTGQPRVLYFSSSAVYPVGFQTKERYSFSGHEFFDAGSRDQRECMWLHEFYADLGFGSGSRDAGGPDADYGWAKLCGERLARNARELGVNVHVVRPFSGFGADQSRDYPFPSIIDRAKKGDLYVWGPERQSRDFIHIEDVINGALAVVDADFQDPVNLCTGRAITMVELMREALYQLHMKDAFTYPLHVDAPIVCDETKPTGVFYRVGSPELMNQFYTAQISLEEGVRRALG